MALVERKKIMLNAVRTVVCKEFDWQESLKDTVLANREATFSSDEMYAALESVCREGEDLDSKVRVARYIDGLASGPFSPIRLSKVGESYKYVG